MINTILNSKNDLKFYSIYLCDYYKAKICKIHIIIMFILFMYVCEYINYLKTFLHIIFFYISNCFSKRLEKLLIEKMTP